jgi:hypothetical protein
MTDYVTITAKEYEELKARDDELTLLENAGVDNWEWYCEALRGQDEDD